MYVGGDMMKLGMFLIRWMLVILFLVYGILKFVDLDGIIYFLGFLGLLFIIVVLMLIGEVVGGLVFIIGFLMFYVNVFYICVMLGLIFIFKFIRGYVSGYEFEIIYIVMNLVCISSYSWKKWL